MVISGMSVGTLSMVVMVVVVGGVEGSECNTTLELSPGQLVRLTNPAVTEENQGGHTVCWYNINQLLSPLSQPGVIRISVSRWSLSSPPHSQIMTVISPQVQYRETGDKRLCWRLPPDPGLRLPDCQQSPRLPLWGDRAATADREGDQGDEAHLLHGQLQQERGVGLHRPGGCQGRGGGEVRESPRHVPGEGGGSGGGDLLRDCLPGLPGSAVQCSVPGIPRRLS